jgi:hypothetical protein
VNGGIVSSLFRYLVDINKFQPYVVVLQIGSSDVGNIEHYVEKVGNAMKYFIDMLYDMSNILSHIGFLIGALLTVPHAF